MSEEINIALSQDDAWVLFELTRRFSDSEKLSIEDHAEERAFWNLCCVFEKVLHQEPDVGYEEYISGCRSRLRDDV